LSPLVLLWYVGGLLPGVDFVWRRGVCFWWLFRGAVWRGPLDPLDFLITF